MGTSDDVREWLVYHVAAAEDLPREMIRAMPDDHLCETATGVLILAPRAALAAATARLAEVEAERDQAREGRRELYEGLVELAGPSGTVAERVALVTAALAAGDAARNELGILEGERDDARADLRADRLALARLQEAGGTLAHLLQHCRTTVAAERRAGIARWAEALAGGPEPAQGEAQPEAEAARPGHTIPLRLPDVPRPRTGGAGCAGAGYDED